MARSTPPPHPLSVGLDPPLGGEEEEESDWVVAYVTPPRAFFSFLLFAFFFPSPLHLFRTQAVEFVSMYLIQCKART